MTKRPAVDNPTEEDGLPNEKQQRGLDFFYEHFCQNLDLNFVKKLNLELGGDTKKLKLNAIDNHAAQFTGNGFDVHWEPADQLNLSYENVAIDPRLLKNLKVEGDQSDVSRELFGVIGRYMSLCCITKSLNYLDVYCVHVLNHILRTRRLIINNQKLIDKAGISLTDDFIDSTRDQGFSRPKILILSPFKKFAYEIVQKMISILLPNEQNYVLNLKKFEEEYGDNGRAIDEKWRASEEFKKLMSGNIDDSFRIGLSLGKKALKLYTAFENSDIIISSPLGLRMIIGDEEEAKEKRESDFLSSIEILIIDKVISSANVLLMQNWEHLLTVVEALNSVPVNIKTDISRVRQWVLQGQGSTYRQTLAFSDLNFTELHALMSKNDKNYAGNVVLTRIPTALLHEIEFPIVQELHRFVCEDPERQSDLRFAYFVRNILPKVKVGTLVFVSSYFDYVRLRNYLKKDNESFAQIHEYASDSKIRKSRKAFGDHQKKILLLTERCQFFRHFAVRGVRSLVFYQMPFNPAFYTDIINMVTEEVKIHSRLIYSKYDALRLQNVFGPAQAKELLRSEQNFHALISE
ncbi:U3 small nucleolar RNA-associated protein 25-like protein [Aphelenchoides besseyi]|nr:U3 small nucleolar RNA-associated protein 25-like protein [Aphelenchoides besseyi]KAI6227042.1 U3 small nucleolar RNA-associated protein 25-like protein [Aphelenchoides besseyi]